MSRTRMGTRNGPHEKNGKAPASDQRTSSVAQPTAQPKPLVLIVEDEKPLAEALAYVVEDCGYTPIVATQGQKGLELARSHHPALIITDLMMPLLDGAELIAALHAEAAADAHSPPPIILTTAAGFRRAEEAGADAILRKPFDISEVEQLLHHFLHPPA